MAARSRSTRSRARAPPCCAVCRPRLRLPRQSAVASRTRRLRRADPTRGQRPGTPFRRRILEMQRLARMDQRMDRMRRQRRLGEARQDQLELAGIGGDVADREDPGPRGRAGRRDRRRCGCASKARPPWPPAGRDRWRGRKTATGNRPRAGGSAPARSATTTAESCPPAPSSACS